MYVDVSKQGGCMVLIPAEVILNYKVKQLLPIYITLYIHTNQFAYVQFQNTTSIKEICYLTNTINTNNLRGSQYDSVRGAVEWLINNGYVQSIDYDTGDVNKRFHFKFIDSIYDKICRAQDDWRKRYLSINIEEIQEVMSILSNLNKNDNCRVNVLRAYLCMRYYSGYWQSSYNDKLPAFCGNLTWIAKRLKIPARTFDRVEATLKAEKLIMVTHRDFTKTNNAGRRPTIVVFNLLCTDKGPEETTYDVEYRLLGVSGKNSGYYIPGMSKANYTNDIPKSTQRKIEQSVVCSENKKRTNSADITDQMEQKEFHENTHDAPNDQDEIDLTPYIDFCCQTGGVLHKDAVMLREKGLLDKVFEEAGCNDASASWFLASEEPFEMYDYD